MDINNLYIENGTLQRDRSIGRGSDSLVFLNGSDVYKFYCVSKGSNHELSLEDIKNYQRITNAVSRYYQEVGMVYHIKGTEVDLKVEVNPIDEVFWHEKVGCPVAVSKYIDGVNYANMINGKSITNIEALENMWGGIYELGTKLNEIFKFDVIALASINAKFFLYEATPRLVITDLCSSLWPIKILSS